MEHPRFEIRAAYPPAGIEFPAVHVTFHDYERAAAVAKLIEAEHRSLLITVKSTEPEVEPVR